MIGKLRTDESRNEIRKSPGAPNEPANKSIFCFQTLSLDGNDTPQIGARILTEAAPVPFAPNQSVATNALLDSHSKNCRAGPSEKSAPLDLFFFLILPRQSFLASWPSPPSKTGSRSLPELRHTRDVTLLWKSRTAAAHKLHCREGAAIRRAREKSCKASGAWTKDSRGRQRAIQLRRWCRSGAYRQP